MGATASKGTPSPYHAEAYASFNEVEREQMRQAFTKCCGSDVAFANQNAVHALLHLPQGFDAALLASLLNASAAQHDDVGGQKSSQAGNARHEGVSLHDIVLLKYQLERAGTATQTALVSACLQSLGPRQGLARWIEALVGLGHDGAAADADAAAAPGARDFVSAVSAGLAPLVGSAALFKAWPGLVGRFSAVTAAFPGGVHAGAAPAPALLRPPSPADSHKLLLHADWRALLASLLPQSQRGAWELLFNSDMHGKSYSTFFGRVAGAGPSLLVVRDTGGAVFGGYAAEAWEKQGRFYGQASSFVFRLLPTFSVHFASGVNTNFQWCGYQFKELPNGVALGGQLNYFSLYVDDSLDAGQSRPAATYAAPSLSSSEVFEVDCAECWLLERRDAGAAAGGGTAMERFAEDKALLELHGRTMHSDAYRAPEPLDED